MEVAGSAKGPLEKGAIRLWTPLAQIKRMQRTASVAGARPRCECGETPHVPSTRGGVSVMQDRRGASVAVNSSATLCGGACCAARDCVPLAEQHALSAQHRFWQAAPPRDAKAPHTFRAAANGPKATLKISARTSGILVAGEETIRPHCKARRISRQPDF